MFLDDSNIFYFEINLKMSTYCVYFKLIFNFPPVIGLLDITLGITLLLGTGFICTKNPQNMLLKTL